MVLPINDRTSVKKDIVSAEQLVEELKKDNALWNSGVPELEPWEGGKKFREIISRCDFNKIDWEKVILEDNKGQKYNLVQIFMKNPAANLIELDEALRFFIKLDNKNHEQFKRLITSSPSSVPSALDILKTVVEIAQQSTDIALRVKSKVLILQDFVANIIAPPNRSVSSIATQIGVQIMLDMRQSSGISNLLMMMRSHIEETPERINNIPELLQESLHITSADIDIELITKILQENPRLLASDEDNNDAKQQGGSLQAIYVFKRIQAMLVAAGYENVPEILNEAFKDKSFCGIGLLNFLLSTVNPFNDETALSDHIFALITFLVENPEIIIEPDYIDIISISGKTNLLYRCANTTIEYAHGVKSIFGNKWKGKKAEYTAQMKTQEEVKIEQAKVVLDFITYAKTKNSAKEFKKKLEAIKFVEAESVKPSDPPDFKAAQAFLSGIAKCLEGFAEPNEGDFLDEGKITLLITHLNKNLENFREKFDLYLSYTLSTKQAFFKVPSMHAYQFFTEYKIFANSLLKLLDVIATYVNPSEREKFIEYIREIALIPNAFTAKGNNEVVFKSLYEQLNKALIDLQKETNKNNREAIFKKVEEIFLPIRFLNIIFCIDLNDTQIELLKKYGFSADEYREYNQKIAEILKGISQQDAEEILLKKHKIFLEDYIAIFDKNTLLDKTDAAITLQEMPEPEVVAYPVQQEEIFSAASSFSASTTLPVINSYQNYQQSSSVVGLSPDDTSVLKDTQLSAGFLANKQESMPLSPEKEKEKSKQETLAQQQVLANKLMDIALSAAKECKKEIMNPSSGAVAMGYKLGSLFTSREEKHAGALDRANRIVLLDPATNPNIKDEAKTLLDTNKELCKQLNELLTILRESQKEGGFSSKASLNTQLVAAYKETFSEKCQNMKDTQVLETMCKNIDSVRATTQAEIDKIETPQKEGGFSLY